MKSALSGVAHILVNTGLMLAIVPVFIGKLGIETYGVYALIMAVGNLGTFTNFGFNTSLIKYLVEQKDRPASNNDIWVTLSVVGVTSLSVAALLLGFQDRVVVHVLQLGPAVYDDTVRFFYVASLLSGALQVLSQIPSAVLDSQQKVYITNGVQLVVGSLGKGSILLSLIVAPNLATIGWITLGTQLLILLSLSVLARWVWGSMYAPGFWGQFLPVARKHFVYGRSIYASSIMFFFYEPVTKILIGRYIGVTGVGFFDIALKVKGMVWSVMERLLYPVLPLIAAKERSDDVRRVIEEVQQKLLLIVIPLAVGTVFLSEPVMELWLGTHLPEVVLGTVLIVTTYLVALTFVPLYQYLAIKGHPEKTLVLQTVNVVVNIGTFMLLVPSVGYFGAVAAFCAAVLSSTSLCAWYQWKLLGSHPIPSLSFASRLGRFFISLVVVNVLIVQIPMDESATFILLTSATVGLSIAFLRLFHLITIDDIERYIGRQGKIARLVERILIEGTRV